MPSTKTGLQETAKIASEKALLDVVRIVGNQRDLLQRWLRRRDAQCNRRSPPADIGYPTLIRH